ncbi:MAG: hypothetical protein K6C40_00825, partial [Thermoguttaceae bacterium]|nr:hypothetical protein [Thermoguttaceae bacterium]
MKKWILCVLVFSLLFCGCGRGPQKSPLVGKNTDYINCWTLTKINKKSFSKSWDDMRKTLNLVDVVPEKCEDLF